MRYRSRQARQRSRKKVLIALLITQIACLFLWASLWGLSKPQSESNAPTETVTLSFLLNPSEKGYWDEVISAFETEHPNITIDLITNPGVTEDASLTDVRASIYGADFQLAEAAYDLVFMDVVWTEPFKNNLIDLNTLINKDKRRGDDDGFDSSDFLQSEIEAGTIDGKFYRMPMYADVGLLYYRKDWLEAAGLDVESTIAPTTVEALEKTIQALRDFSENESSLQNANVPDIEYGYLWQGLEYEGLVANFMEVLGGQGGSWIDEKKNVRLNEVTAVESADTLRQLIERKISPEKVIEYTEDNSKQDFIEGKAVFLRGWPNFWTAIVEAGLEDKVAVTRPFSFSTNPGKGCRGGWGLGISKNAAHPEAAWEAIKYFTGEEGQRAYTSASGSLPTRKVLLQENTRENTSQYIPQMIEYLEDSSVFRPRIEEYNQVSKRLQRALFNILEDKTSSVTAAMKIAQKETETILSGDQ